MSLHVAISGWLLGPPSGANRRLLAMLAEAGPRLAADERLTVLHRPDFLPPVLANIGWCPLAIPAGPTWRRVRAERLGLAGRLREIGATVYEHGFLPLPKLPLPTCLLLHDLRAADAQTRWPRWLARAVLRRSCARASAIVVPSEWTKRRLLELVPEARSPHVIQNGVEVPSAAPAALPANFLPLPACGYLLHVGHQEARKNLAVVVEALALLPATSRPELWLVGSDGGARRALLDLAERRQCRPSVRVLGTVPDLLLASLYAAARAIVVPSVYEGFGLPLLEALAHGRTVLASDRTSLPEVLGEHGRLLPAETPQAWATAIASVTPTDPGTARRRRDHAAKFPWSRCAAAELDLWRQLAHWQSVAEGVSAPA